MGAEDIVELVVEQCRQILHDCNFLTTAAVKSGRTPEEQWKLMESATLTTGSVIKIISASKLMNRNSGDLRGRSSLSRFQKHSTGPAAPMYPSGVQERTLDLIVFSPGCLPPSDRIAAGRAAMYSRLLGGHQGRH